MELCFGGSSGDLFADRRYEMALQLAEGGDPGAAIDLLKDALRLAPSWPPLHFHLGDILRTQKRFHEAEAALTAYLSLDPEDKMGAGIKLALMGRAPAHDAMSRQYVRVLFDQYAPKFETCLLNNLAYQTPCHLESAVRAIKPHGYGRLLDLGCGTGLAAAPFKGEIPWIEGVDLSPAMIKEAQSKDLYHALHICDVATFLSQEKTMFDLILCADVFVYMSDLSDVFQQTASRLEKGGLFAFSVQRLEQGTWTLGEDHRFSHARPYVEQCAENAGLSTLSHIETVLRQDAGRDVEGMIFVCRKD